MGITSEHRVVTEAIKITTRKFSTSCSYLAGEFTALPDRRRNVNKADRLGTTERHALFIRRALNCNDLIHSHGYDGILSCRVEITRKGIREFTRIVIIDKSKTRAGQ